MQCNSVLQASYWSATGQLPNGWLQKPLQLHSKAFRAWESWHSVARAGRRHPKLHRCVTPQLGALHSKVVLHARQVSQHRREAFRPAGLPPLKLLQTGFDGWIAGWMYCTVLRVL